MRNWINKKVAELNMWAVEKSEARDEGQGVTEYAVVLGVLVVAIIVAFQTSGIEDGIEAAVDAIVAKLPAAGS